MRPLPLAIRGDLRFDCHRCGDCCRSFVVTIDEEEERRLRAQGWWRRGLRFLRGVVTDGRDAWGRPARVLRRRRDGRCVLLDDDGLCLVQKRFGYEAKPHVCRQFPLVFVRGPETLRVAVSCECTTRHRSVEGGQPLDARRAEVEALADAVTPYRTRFRVRETADGALLDPEAYLALERRILEGLERRPLARALATVAGSARRDAPDGEPTERLDDALEAMLPIVMAHAEDPGRAPLSRAARALARPGAWSRALERCDEVPEAAAFLRAIVAGWIDEAVPARAPTAEDGIGRMLLGALLCAAPALDGGLADLPAAMNAVAKVASLAFRGARGEDLRTDLGRYDRLARAWAAERDGGSA